jgi:hypothetical protein
LITLLAFPVTRLSVTALELGWLKLTVAVDPILKLCQLMTAELLLWFTFIVVLICVTLTEPLAALAPAGS